MHVRYGRPDLSLFATGLALQFAAAKMPGSPADQLYREVRQAAAAYPHAAPLDRDRTARRLVDRFRTLMSGFIAVSADPVLPWRRPSNTLMNTRSPKS